jgi:subtilase family serine protease
VRSVETDNEPVSNRTPGTAGRAILSVVLSLITIAAVATAPRTQRSSAESGSPAPVPTPTDVVNGALVSLPTSTDCQVYYGLTCYTPAQIRRAYNLEPLYAKGLDGTGMTMAIVVEFGSPTIRRDLALFDKAFGLPDPPSFRILRPVGDIPPFDPHDDFVVGYAWETTLDVEWAHAIAPGANILLVETPEVTTSAGGFVNTADAERYVVDRGLADVISQSFGWSESLINDKAGLSSLRAAYRNARTKHVTVVASSGDDGPVYYVSDGGFYLYPDVSWPASDPLVTGVGGLQLHLDDQGNRLRPDSVWNETNHPAAVADPPTPEATGGGPSALFRRPAYQNGVQNVVGKARGVPDISLSAAIDGAVLLYASFPTVGPGFVVEGGTSEAAPQLAGIVAIADQAAGHPIGQLNPLLYRLAARHAPGIVDVTDGNNTVQYRHGGTIHTAQGWEAVAGYDLASGLGTVDAAKLVPELVRLDARRA